MAEGLLFDTAGRILEALGSDALEEFAMVCSVKAEIGKLENTVRSIKAVVLDAEKQYSKKNNQVTEWLLRLKDAVYDADDLLDDFFIELKQRELMSEVRIFFSRLNQIAYSLKMGHKIKTIRHKLDEIRKDRQFHLIEYHDENPVENTGRETHSFVHEQKVIGRDDDKKAVIELLLNSNDVENVSVISIVGIGGLGKTTLARLAYNDEKVINHFQSRMWVCVSDNFDVKIIIEKIIKSATNKRVEKLDMDQLQKQLRKEIDGKRYLLVLDDIWNENPNKWSELEELLINGIRGSKILITTRSKGVASVTSKFPYYGLKGLQEDESWSLFKQIAFQQSEEPKDIKLVAIGKDIVAKCAGVPLAIGTIGRLLFDNYTVDDWLHFRDNELSEIDQEESDILPILKLSYDHLPTQLKQCFAYCALFPKDCNIEKHKLIQLWMAQGFLHSERVGDKYFMNLLSKLFFQDVKYDKWGNATACKMHDLIHDLAQLVAGSECTMATMDAKAIHERARHVSFDCNLHLGWEIPITLPRAKHVRTFLLPFQYVHAECRLNESNCNKILSKFWCLRMLDLSKSGIEMLPSSIGKLKHLRYLDLSYNNRIKRLPNSMSRLLNLQTLDLSFCSKLKELPRDIRTMVSLRHLVIEECFSLTNMPIGLGLLTRLRTLPLFIASRNSSELGELQGLNNLRGELQINIKFGHIKNDLTPRLAILEAKQYLQSLTLKWERKPSRIKCSEVLLQGLQPHANLKELTVNGFGGMRLSTWISSLTNLTTLSLFSCMRCQHLPPLDQLPSLESLYLHRLNDLKYISDQGSNSSSFTLPTTFFPSLKELEIYSCPRLKGWWMSDYETVATQMAKLPSFPCLSTLIINNCPNLTSMPLYPLLEELFLSETSSKPLQQTMMMSTSSPAPSTSSSFCAPLSKLKSVLFEKINDIEPPLEDWLRNLTSVLALHITSCPVLTCQLSQGIRHLKNLQSMSIGQCEELDLLNDADDKQCQWKGLMSLHLLQFFNVSTMVSLPRGIQHVTSLQNLLIVDCPNLMALPEWICNFTSLAALLVDGCHNLTSLPKGMQLQKLIVAHCPKLSERYGNSMAADWPIISHIPNIQIDWQWIQLVGRYQLNFEG